MLLYKRTLLLLFSLCFLSIHLNLLSQSDSNQSASLEKYKENKIRKFKQSKQKAADFFSVYASDLGIGQDSEFRLLKESFDPKTEITHQKYHQKYKGIKVIGGTYNLHLKDGAVFKSSGSLFPFININTKPRLDSNTASELAISRMKDKFSDEIIIGAEWISYQPELCIIDIAYPKIQGKNLLAYEIIVETEGREVPFKRKVYIDASNGKLINDFTEIMSDAVPGRFKTFRYGEQILTTDSIAPDKFLLRDPIRNIAILDANTENDTFVDNNNVWDSFNIARDEIAGDAHYCTTQFHKMMMDYFNWNGLDNEGGELLAVVHSRGRYYNNAFWNGTSTNYGNGDCERYHPFTVLDVVGHEFTHGIIDKTSDLVYKDEPARP